VTIPAGNVERGPAAPDWRQGAAALAVLTVEVDGEAALLGLGDHHENDLTAMSHQAYGPRVGLPRILQLVGQMQVPATFFVPGVTAERWPKAVESILLAGHEVALHGHTHRPLNTLTPDEQKRDFEQGWETLAKLGVTPRGYRAPFCQLTRATLDLVAQADLIYDSSLMDDDRPYRLRIGSGGLAELPTHWALDDTVPYAVEPELPSAVADTWIAELDAMRSTGSMCVLSVHDFLTGRPSRMRALEKFLTYAKEKGDVKFARADRAAEVALGGVR
jgi:peptidoglycan/xylan/chitin deacetylase (PgdA/CDA1 family)